MYLNCEDYLNENCQKYKTNESDLHNVKPTANLRTLLYGQDRNVTTHLDARKRIFLYVTSAFFRNPERMSIY